MKVIIHSISTNPKYAKFFEWGKLIAITGGTQVLVQIIGMISGLLIVRLLSAQEYALYTLANIMLGTMTTLADGGIATGVMAEGGKVWQDQKKLGSVLKTGLVLRKKFAIVSLLMVSPVLFYLLVHHGATSTMAFLILLSLIPAFLTSISGSILQTIPRLHQKITPLQNNQLVTNVMRLIISSLTVILFPYAFLATLTSGLPQFWSNQNLRKITNSLIDWNQNEDYNVRKNILRIVKRMLPGAIYYSFLGQLTIWLISLFGKTTSLAQIGALGRITITMNILNVLFTTLVVPRFARLENDKLVLLRRLVQILLFLFLTGLGITGLTYLSAPLLLSFLGKTYAGLETELTLLMVGSYLSLVSGILYHLGANRNWVINPIISSIISISSIFSGIHIFRISELNGVLLLNIFTSTVYVFLLIVYLLNKVSKLKSTSFI